MMEEFIIANAIGTVLIFITSAIVYETLAVLWHYLPRLPLGRLRVAVVMLAIFLCHILAIWLYGITYWYLGTHQMLGGFTGPSLTEVGHLHDLFSHI